MEIKTCIRCNEEKQSILFVKKKKEYTNICKECNNAYKRDKYKNGGNKKKKEYAEKNKDKISKNNKEYRENNREKLKIKRKEWYNDNRDIILIQKKEYYKENSIIILEKEKQRRLDDIDKYIEKDKKYYAENREIIIKRSVMYEQKRKAIDPIFKLKLTLRTRFKKAMGRKSSSGMIVNLLGCSIEELKIYLEKQFYSNSDTGEEMTFDNHEQFGWHIDHIKPLASFDLTDMEQLKKAWHYTNLQPLWWKENLAKGKKTNWGKK